MDHPDRLIESSSTVVKIGAYIEELLLVPARTSCQHYSSIAQVIDCSQLFRYDDRISHCGNQGRDAECDLACNSCKMGERRNAFEDSLIWSSAVSRHQQVISTPDRVEPHLFGFNGDSLDRIRSRRFSVIRDTYTEFHGTEHYDSSG